MGADCSNVGKVTRALGSDGSFFMAGTSSVSKLSNTQLSSTDKHKSIKDKDGIVDFRGGFTAVTLKRQLPLINY